MEEDILNRSARFKNKEGDGLLYTGSRLAERVKNIDGKILGKDGKPLKKVYRSRTFGENIKNTNLKTGRVDTGVVNPPMAEKKHDNCPAAVHSHVGSNLLDDGDDIDSHSCNMTSKKFNGGEDSCTFWENFEDSLRSIIHIETECLNQQTTGLPRNPIPEPSTTKKCKRKETQSSTKPSCSRELPKKKAEHTPPVPLPSLRRNKLPWTEKEEEILEKGMQRYASANISKIPWKRILYLGRNVFHERRTPLDLKDKWRNMQGRRKHM